MMRFSPAEHWVCYFDLLLTAWQSLWQLCVFALCMYSKYKDVVVKVLVIFKCYQLQYCVCVYLTMEIL